jgi:hypothetical protein
LQNFFDALDFYAEREHVGGRFDVGETWKGRGDADVAVVRVGAMRKWRGQST